MQINKDDLTLEVIQQLFEKSADIQFQQFVFQHTKVHFITCEAMVDLQLLHEIVIPHVKQYCENHDPVSPQTLLKELYIPNMAEVKNMNDVTTAVYTGNLLIYFEDCHVLITSNIAKKPNRNPEETRMEVVVKGPRDNFIEDIAVNIALIRKRLPTNALCVEKFEVGRRSKTAVAILYFDDIVDQTILNSLKQKIQELDVATVASADLMMESINQSSKLFPRTDYTGRPDFAIQSLEAGRFIILVDGVSYATITPVNLLFLFKSGEDNGYPIISSSIERLIRIAGFLIGVLLPGFWLALISFHQNQLPLQLLATVVMGTQGLPFPRGLEMLVMLFMFELFREASLSLPTIIGGTVSVVGGLIIGDAAIRAGITSPAMIVVIATSSVATYVVNNQAALTAVSVFRIIVIVLSSIFGLFGFFISLFFLLVYLASIRTFGFPYLNIASDLNWETIKTTLFRVSEKAKKERMHKLATKDRTRTRDDNNEN